MNKQLLAAVAVAASLSAAAAAAQEVASLPQARTAVPRFKACITLTVPSAELGYATIPLPAGAKVRGFALSGQATMCQNGTAGSTVWDKRPIHWDAHYNLTQGCALINAESPALIDALPASAFIDKQTTAVVHRDGDATRFVNLTDHHRNSMRIVFGNHYVDLDPGFELVLVKTNDRNLKQIAVQEGIGWREMREMTTDGLTVFVYRVNGPDLLTKCKIYKQLNQSKLAVDHKLRDELVRTVAALETMYNRKRGPFKLDKPYLYGPGADTKEASRPQQQS